jgi:predicted esterase
LGNWPGKFTIVCGTINLLAAWGAMAQGDLPQPAVAAPSKPPAIVLLDASDAPQWQAWVGGLGWKVIAPPAGAGDVDARVQALDAAVREAIRGSGVDPGRVYLAGRGAAVASVFYAVSRVPDLWAAALALGGSPEAAVTTGRLFAVNFTGVPVLWIGPGTSEPELAGKLKNAGVNLEWRAPAGIANAAIFEWLGEHRRDEFPASIDCETNSPAFGRCYWIQMTRFDPGERNDVLPSTRVPPGSGASLDLGVFGFKPDDPGPGLLVSFLGEKYNGPLKLGDRIAALDGRPIENPRQYAETMNRYVENRPVTVMVERGKDRIRLETAIVVPRRDPALTARVQARFDAVSRTIEIVSRVVAEMRVTVPPHWVPGSLNWNGLSIEAIDKPGCIQLRIEKELLHASACSAN